MIVKIFQSILVAIVVFLACIFLGGLLELINIDFVEYIGEFIQKFALVFAIIAGLWFYFGNPRGKRLILL